MNVVDWIITVIGVVVLLGFAIGYPVIYFHAKFEEITHYWLCIAMWSTFIAFLIKIT
jgi:ABC-type spermidine/putrescine transport system permease subunit I